MKIVFQFILGVVLVGILQNNLNAQELLTLEEAIRIGLEKNYDIRIAENDQDILSNNYDYGKYNFLPTINASGAKNFDVQDIEQGRNNESGDTVIIANNATSSQLSASVDLEWTIFNGLGMFITYDKLNEFRRAGESNFKAVIEGTISEISAAYYAIVLEKEKIKVLENTLGLSEKRKEIAQAVFEVGRSSKLEYLAAQVDLNADLSELIDQEERYYNAKLNLNRVIGRAVDTEFEVINTIDVPQEMDLAQLKLSLEENNPYLQVLESNQRITQLETKEIRAERFPEINLNTGYRYNDSESQVSFASYNIYSGYYYGISASIPILNGMNITRRIQNAKIQQESSKIVYDQTKTDLTASLNSYYLSYQNALELLKLETENLEIAKESEDIAYDRYTLGNANFLELREAQRNAVEAESRLIDASYKAKIAEIELLRISGQLLQSSPAQN